MKKISFTTAAMLFPTIASAHPDHFSLPASSAVHFLTDPFHVGLVSALVAGLVIAWRVPRRSRAGRADSARMWFRQRDRDA